MKIKNLLLAGMILTLGLVTGCTDENPAASFDLSGDVGWGTDDSGNVQVTDGSTTITEDSGASWTCKKTLCAGVQLECGDCIDNDKDGKVDSRDPECAGACDNSESVEGWTTDDSGQIKVGDGGVIITADGGTKYVCQVTTCMGKTLECGDCKDNDGDGWTDWKDPECLGPCDNTEGPALIGGIGGQTSSNCKVDCYFDFGNGSGWDGCAWDHRCDPLEPEKPWGCEYDAKMVGTKKCPVPQDKQCTQKCLPLTPNGCDCFGCCTFPDLMGKGPKGTDGYVWIGAMDTSTKEGTCTLKDVLNQKKCPRCTPVKGCNNPCGRCELCIGKTTLPPDCYKQNDGGVATPDKGVTNKDTGGTTNKDTGGTTNKDTGSTTPKDSGGSTKVDQGVPPSNQCPGGEVPCGLPGQPNCKSGWYCITGCCQPIIIN